LLRIARVIARFDQAQAVRVLEQGIAGAIELPEDPRSHGDASHNHRALLLH